MNAIDFVRLSLEQSKMWVLGLITDMKDAKDFFATVGHCLSAIPMHFVFHGGQVADARRAAGRDVLMG